MSRKRKKRANRKVAPAKPKVPERLGDGMAPAVVVGSSEHTHLVVDGLIEHGQASLFEMPGFEAEVAVEAETGAEGADVEMAVAGGAQDNPQAELGVVEEPVAEESAAEEPALEESAVEESTAERFASDELSVEVESCEVTEEQAEAQAEEPVASRACAEAQAEESAESPVCVETQNEGSTAEAELENPQSQVEVETDEAAATEPSPELANDLELTEDLESVEELLADVASGEADTLAPSESAAEQPDVATAGESAQPAAEAPTRASQPRMSVDIQQLGANELPVAPLMVPAADLLAGAVRTEAVSRGWVRPWRFFVPQVRAQESCLAWYPGIYRQMVRCTAGMCLEFETDATEFAVELRVDPEPRATRKVLRAVDGDFPEPHDGITVEVDGQWLACFMPASTVAASPVPAKMGDCLKFNLSLNDSAQQATMDALPGMGDTHLVRLWLPVLRGCELGRVAASGSQLKPCERPETSGLLVLGDSVSQGFVVDDPTNTWPVLVGKRLGMPLLNQSVGAQVFQPSALSGLGAIKDPELIVVALGANYRYGRCNSRLVSREIAEYLGIVDRMFPEVPLIVVPPAPAEGRQVASGSCYAEVPEIARAAAQQLKRRRVADGHAALVVAEVPALWNRHLADADGHPTAEGAALFADVICEAAEQFACRCLRDLGTFGRCGACVCR